MNIVTKIEDWLAIRKHLKTKNMGVVMTMGHLHEGHLSLCKRSQKENDITIVTIFVNPTQFNLNQDYEKYPRTLETDKEMLASINVDYLLLFEASDLYPDAYEVRLQETVISKELEGEYRPGHFEGMMTIVLKFLNLTQAAHAYFGEKDYQQYLLVKKMARALFVPTKIVGCETVRTSHDLALSSRNSRLSVDQLEKAVIFPNLLKSNLSLKEIKDQLTRSGFKVDYIAEKWQRRLGAVWLDEVRLIDNVPI